MRSWLAGLQERHWRWGDASATALVERGILIILLVLRVGLVIQVLLASVVILNDPRQSVASALVGLVASVFSIALILTLLRKQRFPGAWVTADVVIAATALVVTSALDPPASFVGHWTHWAPAYALQAPVFFAGWSKSVRLSSLVAGGMGLVYTAATVPSVGTLWPSVLINAISYPVFGLAASVFATYSRRLAADSDSARASAIASAAALELNNYRFHVHDASGLLARLGRPDLRDEELPALRRQAAAEANRLRHEFLLGRPAPTSLPQDGNCKLGQVVWNATADFGHLPLELTLTLGQSALVTARQALALSAALVSLLHNIQFYAQAQSVFIHADADAGAWELVIRDDGVGFDPDVTQFGYVIREQVVGSLSTNGMTVRIESRLGGGTCTTITGPDLSKPDDRSSSSSTTTLRPVRPSSKRSLDY